MQIIHRGERRDAREREGNNCEASCGTCQPFYMVLFFPFFFVRSLLSIFIDRSSYALCIECLSLRIYGNSTHEKGRNYVSHAMHNPLVPPSLSPRLCRTHTRISLFFSCAEIHGRVEEVESEPLVAIENREKTSVLKTFFVATCTCICVITICTT